MDFSVVNQIVTTITCGTLAYMAVMIIVLLLLQIVIKSGEFFSGIPRRFFEPSRQDGPFALTNMEMDFSIVGQTMKAIGLGTIAFEAARMIMGSYFIYFQVVVLTIGATLVGPDEMFKLHPLKYSHSLEMKEKFEIDRMIDDEIFGPVGGSEAVQTFLWHRIKKADRKRNIPKRNMGKPKKSHKIGMDNEDKVEFLLRRMMLNFVDEDVPKISVPTSMHDILRIFTLHIDELVKNFHEEQNYFFRDQLEKHFHPEDDDSYDEDFIMQFPQERISRNFAKERVEKTSEAHKKSFVLGILTPLHGTEDFVDVPKEYVKEYRANVASSNKISDHEVEEVRTFLESWMQMRDSKDVPKDDILMDIHQMLSILHHDALLKRFHQGLYNLQLDQDALLKDFHHQLNHINFATQFVLIRAEAIKKKFKYEVVLPFFLIKMLAVKYPTTSSETIYLYLIRMPLTIAIMIGVNEVLRLILAIRRFHSVYRKKFVPWKYFRIKPKDGLEMLSATLTFLLTFYVIYPYNNLEFQIKLALLAGTLIEKTVGVRTRLVNRMWKLCFIRNFEVVQTLQVNGNWNSPFLYRCLESFLQDPDFHKEPDRIIISVLNAMPSFDEIDRQGVSLPGAEAVDEHQNGTASPASFPLLSTVIDGLNAPFTLSELNTALSTDPKEAKIRDLPSEGQKVISLIKKWSLRDKHNIIAIMNPQSGNSENLKEFLRCLHKEYLQDSGNQHKTLTESTELEAYGVIHFLMNKIIISRLKQAYELLKPKDYSHISDVADIDVMLALIANISSDQLSSSERAAVFYMLNNGTGIGSFDYLHNTGRGGNMISWLAQHVQLREPSRQGSLVGPYTPDYKKYLGDVIFHFRVHHLLKKLPTDVQCLPYISRLCIYSNAVGKRTAAMAMFERASADLGLDEVTPERVIFGQEIQPEAVGGQVSGAKFAGFAIDPNLSLLTKELSLLPKKLSLLNKKLSLHSKNMDIKRQKQALFDKVVLITAALNQSNFGFLKEDFQNLGVSGWKTDLMNYVKYVLACFADKVLRNPDHPLFQKIVAAKQQVEENQTFCSKVLMALKEGIPEGFDELLHSAIDTGSLVPNKIIFLSIMMEMQQCSDSVSIPEVVTYYTDGSARKINGERRAGCGFYCVKGSQTESFRVSDHANPGQAELMAIYQALEHAVKRGTLKVLIHTDCRPAQHLIKDSWTNELLARRIQHFVRDNKVELIINWVKGHAGIDGNIKADEAAIEGAKKDVIDHHIVMNHKQVCDTLFHRLGMPHPKPQTPLT